METENKRLMSLDALRGADMLFITGLSSLMIAICHALGCDGSWFAQQFHHVPWNGLHFQDTIFPLFLFLAGVSFPFSCAKSLERGLTKGRVARKAFWRALTLFAFGLIYNGVLKVGFGDVVWGSVLGRIGIAWFCAVLVYLYLPGKARVALAVAILVGYWAVMASLVAPDHPDTLPLSPEGNISGYLDRLLLPGKLTVPGLYSNQGLLSTVPAVVTALLGMFAGDYVRVSCAPGGRKVAVLLAAAACLVLSGLLVAFGFGAGSMPLNKILWSTSFTLVVGGCSAAMFALFYFVIDVKGFTGWTFFFRVIGMNSITIYMAQKIIPFKEIAKFFFGGMASLMPGAWGGVLLGLGYIAICWLFLLFLYRKNVFLKV